jgi:hypothetical protein
MLRMQQGIVMIRPEDREAEMSTGTSG